MVEKIADKILLDPRDLAKCVAGRDPVAFGQLYDDHLGRIYRYVLYKVGNQTLAEDLTADVFANAWEGIDRFQWRDLPFEHWLLRIARNVVVDHWRGHRIPTVSIDALESTASDDPTPEDWIVRDFEIENLVRVLGRLQDDQRDVLVLRFIEGHSHKAVAAFMGKSVVAVRQTQVRGLRHLQKEWPKEQWPESMRRVHRMRNGHLKPRDPKPIA